MLELITHNLNFRPEELLIIGDAYESDVGMALTFGSPAILIDNSHKNESAEYILVNDLFSLKKLFEEYL